MEEYVGAYIASSRCAVVAAVARSRVDEWKGLIDRFAAW